MLPQLDNIKITCTLLQTDNHANALSLSFFTGQMLFLVPNQQSPFTEGNCNFTRQSTENKQHVLQLLAMKVNYSYTCHVPVFR